MACVNTSVALLCKLLNFQVFRLCPHGPAIPVSFLLLFLCCHKLKVSTWSGCGCLTLPQLHPSICYNEIQPQPNHVKGTLHIFKSAAAEGQGYFLAWSLSPQRFVGQLYKTSVKEESFYFPSTETVS